MFSPITLQISRVFYISFSVGLRMKLVNKHNFSPLLPSLLSVLTSLLPSKRKFLRNQKKMALSLMLDIKLPWYRMSI